MTNKLKLNKKTQTKTEVLTKNYDYYVVNVNGLRLGGEEKNLSNYVNIIIEEVKNVVPEEYYKQYLYK